MSTTETPNGLDLVIDFVNTLDVDVEEDELQTPRDLDAWLAGRELTANGAAASEADFRHAIELREALRALMLANNSDHHDEQAAAQLERTARKGELGVHFDHSGRAVNLAPAEQGVDGALARLLVPVAQAMADGSWARVKACRADNCGWAFYDRSRNRSGVWCDMAVCGNRTKVRAYRERAPRGSR